MSSVSGIHANSSLIDILGINKNSENSNETLSIAEQSMEKINKALGKQQANSSYQGSYKVGQAALHRAIAEMQASADGPITGQKIKDYQQFLEDKFAATVRIEVTLLGVSPETEFKITMNSDASISVQCDDKQAKQIIEDFLEKNPKVCEEFGYIQALANFNRAKQTPMAAQYNIMQDMKAELQSQAIDIFFGNSLDTSFGYSPVMANFSGGEDTPVSFYAGLNFRV